MKFRSVLLGVTCFLVAAAAFSAFGQDTVVVEANSAHVNGFLGVGAVPAHALHVQMPDPNIVFTDTSGDGSVFLLSVRDTASFFGTATNDTFGIRVNNKDVMRLANGRVGINTAVPTEALHVVGNIRIQGGTLVSADYVFAPDYELMPLAELKTFVTENSHLPNVPAGDDVAEAGINLGQFQMVLLEKVEELVLYTLQQEERIAALEQSNQQMAQQNAELQALARELLARADAANPEPAEAGGPVDVAALGR